MSCPVVTNPVKQGVQHETVTEQANRDESHESH
jgi:hypothetical protein